MRISYSALNRLMEEKAATDEAYRNALTSIPGETDAHMASNDSRRSGRVRRIISRKALTRPTITKLFQRQPPRINRPAILREGFSQKQRTSYTGPLARDVPGSIHP